ncbi:MAG: hypothetical protein ACR2PK_19125 [Acidimicrobiales bacterium]
MAQQRPIDVAVMKVYGAMIGATIVVLGGIALWVAITRDQNLQDAPFLNTAFTLSWLIAILLNAGILEYAKRRPEGAFLSWGEANLAAAYVFFLMFWVYGVVPHQWLTYADNELAWRADKLLIGPTGIGFTDGEGLVSWALPLDITYLVIRDIIAVTIYGLALAGNIAMWSIWQSRGKVAPTEVEQSTYGRPLVREGV